MTAKGKDLFFISAIVRDGSGTMPMEESPRHLQDTEYELNCLSITLGTWIASEFNSYVVKLRSPNKFKKNNQH